MSVLPRPRLLAGIALIGLAAAGTFAASTGAIGAESRNVVVAARDIAPGTRLAIEDLRVATMDVSGDTAGRLASSPSQLVGLVTLGPVASTELLQAGNVVRKASDSSEPEVSIALPASRAVGGSLRAGEVVDVITTDKALGEGAARIAVSGGRVVSSRGTDDDVGGSGDVIVTLAVTDTAKASAVAAAVDLGNVTLVRTTGVGIHA